MSEPIRVLIVEDLPTDAELSEREIGKALGSCEFRRVETREKYLAALDEFGPALIVSDYRLPHFDGMTALKLAVEHCPDVPFIVVTGSMNEDTAVECMRAGAWDYVIKEHVKRLGPAVHSALEQQRVRIGRKRAEVALRNSEAELRAALNATPFPIALVDVQGNNIEFWSHSALTLFGHTAPTAPEWYQMAYPDPDYRREVIERWSPLLEKAHSSGQTVNTGEYRVTCRDGSVRLCELYATFLPNRLVVTFNDITARNQAEAALRESEARFRDIFERSTIGKALTRHDGRLIRVNRAFADMLGFSIEELQRLTLAEITHPDDIAESRECVRSVVSGERTSLRMEKRYRHRDGHWVFGDTSATLLHNIQGTPPCLIASIVDISGRKQAEVALRESEARFRNIFERSTVGQALTGRDGRLLNVNQSLADMLGFSIEELEQVTFGDLTHPDDVAETQKCARSLFAGERTTYRFEKRYIHRDGHIVFADVSSTLLRDDHGAPLCLIKSVVDISAQKRAEEELRFRNVILSTQQEASIDGILVVDVNGKIASSNGRFAEMWGIPSDIMESRSDERALQSVLEKLADPEAFISEVKRLYAIPGEKSRDEIALKDGRTFDRYSAPMLDADGKCFGRVWHFRDITEQKRIETALAAANSELDRRVAERTAELLVSNQELESFAYAVSHDLRAPLRGIDGWSQAVLEDCGPQLDERGRTYLATVRSETHRMAELIDGLLELSRVTRATMKRETVDLTAMAQELEASLRASQPERAVDSVIAPGMVAEGDAVLLRAVLQNLLANAWKFTGKRPRARIEVGCTSEPGRTVYHVRDDGAGFDMRYAGKLFAPFQRLHSFEEFTGTGIGLATVQRIIHRHGGKVWATAEVDQGATFYFTLTA